MVEYWKLAVHLYVCFAVMVRLCSTQSPCVFEPGSMQYLECALIACRYIVCKERCLPNLACSYPKLLRDLVF